MAYRNSLLNRLNIAHGGKIQTILIIFLHFNIFFFDLFSSYCPQAHVLGTTHGPYIFIFWDCFLSSGIVFFLLGLYLLGLLTLLNNILIIVIW